MDADVAALQQLLGSVPAPARTLGSASMAAGGPPPSLSGPPPPSSDSVICGDTEGDDAASGVSLQRATRTARVGEHVAVLRANRAMRPPAPPKQAST